MQTLHLMRHVPGSKSLAQAKKGVDLVVAMGKKLIGRIPHSQEWTLELRRITEKETRQRFRPYEPTHKRFSSNSEFG